MEQYIVEGNISVKAVLLAQKRDIIKIIVDEKKRIAIPPLFFVRQHSAISRSNKTAVKLLMSLDREKRMAGCWHFAASAAFRHCRLSLKRIQFFWH